MSVLLRPRTAAQALRITPHAAVTAAKALEKHTGRPVSIKWVNDIYQNGKKVCGILAEGVSGGAGGPAYVVLGIGVNLKAPPGGYPPPLGDIAGALFPPGEKFDREAILRDILHGLFRRGADDLREYQKRDMLHSRTVTVFRGGEELCTGQALGVDRDFGLLVALPDGSVRTLRGGDVSVRAARPGGDA